MYLSDYKYYETLVSQQSPIQCQFSCCLVTHSTDIPAPAYDWSDTAVSAADKQIYLGDYCDDISKGNKRVNSLILTQQSWPQVIPDVSLSHSVQNESPHFYSILPPQRNSKGDVKICYKTLFLCLPQC